MFSTVLIANRGEIACRVIRTCRRLGIRTVAVYAEADQHALHVELADEAYLIGPSPAQQSYLRGDAIIDVAVHSGAEAIHPGYGFLSENPAFARAAAAAGIVFVGPSPDAMEAVGDKLPARAAARAAGFPLVPGTDDRISLESVDTEARRLGFPVLMKASAGGGGIGITRVDAPDQLEDALRRTSGLADRFFGTPTVYLERLIHSARHIEVQILADTHGNSRTFGTRDCSVQRRHQKVIEEATARAIDSKTETALLDDAVRLAESIGYTNAGTIECLFGDGQYYFLEVNARLQVEHPSTEEVFEIDLVEEQIRVAAGDSISTRAQAAQPRGHAIECRIYAEDPVTQRPMPGTIDELHFPADDCVRVDTGYRSGDIVTPFYDPLIAKLIVRGADRPDAVARLKSVLDETEVTGLTTNLPLLRRVVSVPEFVDGAYDTSILTRLED